MDSLARELCWSVRFVVDDELAFKTNIINKFDTTAVNRIFV